MTRLRLGQIFTQGLGLPKAPRKRARTCRLDARVEGLECRGLMTGGSVVSTPGLITVMPSSTGPNVAIVSYQTVSGTRMLDVNLNGIDHEFSLGQVGFVYYKGSAIGGSQTFENMTSLHTVGWGGSGTNTFISGGTGSDEFFGGTGSNTFYAGTGYDEFIGGSGANTFVESATGSGLIFRAGGSNTIIVTAESTGSYTVY